MGVPRQRAEALRRAYLVPAFDGSKKHGYIAKIAWAHVGNCLKRSACAEVLFDPGSQVIRSCGNIREAHSFETVAHIAADGHISIGEVRMTLCCLINDCGHETRSVWSHGEDPGCDALVGL